MQGHNSLSIILPVYNPHENWDKGLSYSLANLTTLFTGVDYQIVIVNDGSTIPINDKIEKITAGLMNVRYLEYPVNKGKGYAIRYGVAHSDSEYYIYTDHDFPFGLYSVYEAYRLLETHKSDLVFGMRNHSYFNSLPLKRHLISKCLHVANFVMLGFRHIDTQAGLKGFNKRIKNILLDTKTDGFIFEFEFIRNCLRNKCSVMQINLSVGDNVKFSDFRRKTIFRELLIYIRLLLHDG